MLINENALKKEGWEVECESPFEMRHEDGSFVTGHFAEQIASVIMDRSEYNVVDPCYVVAHLCDNDFGHDLKYALEVAADAHLFEIEQLSDEQWKNIIIVHLISYYIVTNFSEQYMIPIDYDRVTHIDSYLTKNLKVTITDQCPQGTGEFGSDYLDLRYPDEAYLY